MSEQKVFKFSGKDIDVTWDGRLCIHIGECGQSEGELFVGGRQPWCVPDTSDAADVREVVERCPSGALSYEDKGGIVEQTASANTVHVTYNGPLYVSGDLNIVDAPQDMPGVRFRAALCRCGQSKNKPFCDNSHTEAGFQDFGAVGKSGSGSTGEGGKLEIKAAEDGPLILIGDFAIVAGSGRTAWRGKKAALCRCGQSKNKPFCDGSHVDAGFKSS
ncbi:MAG: CDGSH iron-sulfur domain-containing protein [Pseudomonadota bacterium]|nr:CDGSH iron-sulfur domain-containing protein [Pseudomonadota bacterium]